MRVAQVAMLAHEARQMQIRWGQFQPHLFVRLAAGAGVGRFPCLRMEFATAGTPETAIRLLRAFEQQHIVPLVEAVKQRGDSVGQRHAGSEAGNALPGKQADAE